MSSSLCPTAMWWTQGIFVDHVLRSYGVPKGVVSHGPVPDILALQSKKEEFLYVSINLPLIEKLECIP